eukprot:CAMPEP_0206049282 /NCGR_PEP_ID=MMETSP1466-20131121/26416_1 /ASSEMBLY_ACC=CAM_ASM_001126 /TAXON_ID=44452 /ORGANISM="Pavlova gyrans, Strain CCMP608" /LENGTH=345 /DNA_ID=CAMNT_0053424363 /DNA_START=86 /DNA_END=1123 /DNA_ORIENTATION=-
MQDAHSGTPKFTRVHTLNEHDALVTGLDWGPNTNRIVSSSQDRNAYVWEFKDGKWTPTLVILRLQRAATCVSWSPDEQKFAVGSGEKVVPVCYFEDQNNFWVSKHMRKHQSTILCVAWSPSSLLLATGGADSKARVMSGYVKGVDAAGRSTPFGADAQFGSVLAEYDCGGWVHAVAWHPNGTTIAFATHDSCVSIASLPNGNGTQQRIRLRELPMKCLCFLPRGALVGVGFSYTPLLFTQQAGSATYNAGVPLQTTSSGAADMATSAVSAARRMFQAQAKAGQEQGVSESARLDSIHQNCVTSLRAFDSKVAGNAVEFTSAGLDGRVVFWTSDELSAAMRNLSVK